MKKYVKRNWRGIIEGWFKRVVAITVIWRPIIWMSEVGSSTCGTMRRRGSPVSVSCIIPTLELPGGPRSTHGISVPIVTISFPAHN